MFLTAFAFLLFVLVCTLFFLAYVDKNQLNKWYRNVGFAIIGLLILMMGATAAFHRHFRNHFRQRQLFRHEMMMRGGMGMGMHHRMMDHDNWHRDNWHHHMMDRNNDQQADSTQQTK